MIQISNALIGHGVSDETKRKISQTKHGVKLSDDVKERRGKLTWKQIESIRKDQRSQRIISKEYDIDQAQISMIKNMKVWIRRGLS
ncbi:hypothetical protein [Ruminiclostridium josui]|uniref:hypothetical protein n=1 Tax=Ruminiclostridium josui TaxID=1499 RepID=UPI00046569BA|nr:hypothetical protein [Ruminiclostridium josui]